MIAVESGFREAVQGDLIKLKELERRKYELIRDDSELIGEYFWRKKHLEELKNKEDIFKETLIYEESTIEVIREELERREAI